MFTADPKILSKIEPAVRRVLIVDPNAAASRVLSDIMKGIGARDVEIELDEKAAMTVARELNPDIVFTERSGPRLDGEAFARKLRRSSLPCRRAPIIMVTNDATAATIKGARDSGVHEFLRKPYTAGDLFKRVEIVTLKPRNWIEAVGYVGPDRRRFNSGEFSGSRKRKADQAPSAAEATREAKDQAMRILASALIQFNADPTQAVRAIREQALGLKALAMEVSDVKLAVAAAGLDVALAGIAPTKASLAGPINALLDLAEPQAAGLARAG